MRGRVQNEVQIWGERERGVSGTPEHTPSNCGVTNGFRAACASCVPLWDWGEKGLEEARASPKPPSLLEQQSRKGSWRCCGHSSSFCRGRGRGRPPGCQASTLLLTVGIQEREHLCLCHAGSQQSGRDQPLPLRLPHHPHELQLLHVLLQLLL